MAERHRTKRHRALQTTLKNSRKKAGLRQSELAERLGKPQSYVSKYESGERKLDLPELYAIADAIGISLDTVVRRYKRNLP